MLELGEDLFDRVQVWRVLRQKEQLGAGRANEPAHGGALMAAEIVHDDDITGPKRGKQDLCDIGSEGVAIDGGVEKWPPFQPVC